MTRTALIVGAGIGGLAAGLALRRAGWDVRVFERAAEPRELGFGLMLAPNAVRALRDLGIAAEVVSQGVRPASAEIRAPGGRVIRRFEVDIASRAPGADAPTMVLRPVLHGALLDALGRDAIALGGCVTGFHVVHGRPEVALSNGARIGGDIVIGADGAGSVIREQLHPGEPAPRPSGYVAVRGASPALDRLGGLQAVVCFDDGVECGIIAASATTIYWYLSLLAADVGRGTEDVGSIVRRATARFDRQSRAILESTPPSSLRLDELFVRDPLRRWGEGPVTLLGDAAHPMLPHTGQGAAQALEDAVALGLLLASPGDPVAALQRYESLRSEPTRRLVRMGPRIARITTTHSRVIAALRNAAVRGVPQAAVAWAFTRAGRHHDAPVPGGPA